MIGDNKMNAISKSEQFTIARNIPLLQALEKIGAVEDAKSKSSHTSRFFRVGDKKVVVKGQKFFIPEGKSGGGAVDLLVYLDIVQKPVEALKILIDTPSDFPFYFPSSGSKAAEPPVAALLAPEVQVAVSELPLPVLSNIEHVKNWLISTRKLDKILIEELVQKGKIYADGKRNAVFLSCNGTACEIRGTGFEKFAGKRGENSSFEIPPLPNFLNQAAFVESAIDAISLRELGFKGRIISTAGAVSKNSIGLARFLIAVGIKITAAFDSDDAGRRYTKQMQEAFECDVLVPVSKDWNDDLRLKK